MVRLGILGCSKHYQQRIHWGLKSSKNIEVFALASRSLSKVEETNHLLEIPNIYDNYEDLISNPLVDVVYLPLPNHLHCEYIKKCITAGKAVLCEKPLSLSFKDTQEVFQLAKKNNILLMEAFMYPFSRQWKDIEIIVKQGEIGKIKLINTVFSYNNPNETNIRNILSYGGGGLYDIGCYPISISSFLLGKKPQKVLSSIVRDSKLKIDSQTSAILDYGETQSIFSVATRQHPHQSVQIIGESGEINVPLPFNAHKDVPQTFSVTNKLGTRNVVLPCDDQYLNEFEAFVQAYKEKKESPYQPQYSLWGAEVIDALWESEKKMTWVPLK